VEEVDTVFPLQLDGLFGDFDFSFVFGWKKVDFLATACCHKKRVLGQEKAISVK
jgi:hypothetical protein